MSGCKEAMIGAINLCFRPLSRLPLKNQCEKGSSECLALQNQCEKGSSECLALQNQCEKGSSEVDKMDMLSEMLPEKVEKMDKWSEMLPDILEDISDRLPLQDFVAFRGVCRKWRSAPSGRSEITSFSKERPWLMFYDFDRKSSNVADDACYLYNWPGQNCCTIRSPHLRVVTIMHSKAGWLFARSRDGHFFLYNPLTLTKIDLPKHIVVEEQVCTITAPTVQNCTVFILSRRTDSALEISSCRVGDTEWKNHTAEISEDRIGTMLGAYCNDRIENEISIKGSKSHLRYDYMNKRCVYEWSIADERAQTEKFAQAGKFMFWDDYLKSPVHQKNWLDRFGEKGISISTCALSMKRDGCIGISGGFRDIAGQSGSTVAHKLVRASWIEPRFG